MGGLAERYVKALVTMDLGDIPLERLRDELSSLADLYTKSRSLRHLFENPAFRQAERRASLDKLVERLALSRLTRNFLMLLTDKKRTRLLPPIARELERYTDAKAGILRARVKVAAPLSPVQQTKLQTVLRELRGRPVHLTTEVHPSLLGGIVVEMEGFVYDGSVHSRLESIREQMLKAGR
jgi:F-type H+-transporting ATPase subunit delta